MMVRKTLLVGAACLALIASQVQARSDILAAVASPDRPKADTDRDADRKPASLLAFAGVKPGQTVADIMPGQGYFTRLFARVVEPKGHVVMLVPAELAQVDPNQKASAHALAADPAYPNVRTTAAPTASLDGGAPVDLAWTSDNYHDLYAFFGVEKAAQFDRAVFAMVKPGGVFIVIDHVATPGADQATMRRLHRIDPAVVKAQVEAAGFRLESTSSVLANPADLHDQPVFAPAIRGHTDQFVFKFRKPGTQK
jgi:predicted methyltransferase